MDKKRLLIIMLVVMLLLSACSGTVDVDNDNRDNLNTEEIDADIVIELDFDKYEEAAKDEEIINLWVKNLYGSYGNLHKYYKSLKEYESTNDYAREVVELYEALDIENMSDFERDYLDFYIEGFFHYKTDFPLKYGSITNVWKIGYDENDNVINPADKKYFRRIFSELESDQGEKSYFMIAIFDFYYNGEYKGCSYNGNSKVSDKEIGFGENKEEGIWSPEIVDDEIDGAPYQIVDMNTINAIVTENMQLLDLLEQCYIRVVLPYMNEEIFAPMEDEKKEPCVGMTKGEVLLSTWGYPDKKNIYKYEWGTKEQWVYEGYKYIYFENGIVTSISY